MTTVYGKFEAVRELYTTATGSVWAARARNSREETDACIKLVQLNETMIEDHDTSVAESLLVSAAIQQTMANKSECWAPVYELGSDGTNAFFVSRLYPRTLQTLIDTQTRLTSSELKTIMLGIIDGLIDLGTAYRRQHGNLKPANVMLTAKGHISHGSLLLADPDAVVDNVPSMTRAPDTKAMGQILYALVTHKPYSGARLPLIESPAWKQLGSSGAQWFALCQRLLDTFSKQGLPELESVRMAIGEIRSTRRRIPRALYVALLLGVTSAGAYEQRNRLGRYCSQGSGAIASMVTKLMHPTPVPPIPPRTTTNTLNPATTRTTANAEDWRAPADNAVRRAALIPTQPSKSVENPVLAVIRSAPAPELHSVPAADAFRHDRDKFLADRASTGHANAVEWDKIYNAVVALDLSYPTPEQGNGWPPTLRDELNGRRDDELVKGVDAVFNGDNADPTGYATELADADQLAAATVSARHAIITADIAGTDSAVKDFTQKLDALASVDAAAASKFDDDRNLFHTFIDARTATDRGALLVAVGDQSVPLAVRLRYWLRLSKAGDTAWPDDLVTLAADREQGQKFAEVAKEFPATLQMITDELKARLDGFFGSLRDTDSVKAAAKQAAAAQLTTLVPLYPDWFQFDVMLARLQQSPALAPTPEQTSAFLGMADKMHAPNSPQLHSAFTAVAQPPRTLADSGPVLAGCRLEPGSNADHRTYLLGNESIEFLRVHQPAMNGNSAVDCYLSTTEFPVSLLQTIFDKNHTAERQAAQSLNGPEPASASMRIWSFAADGIQLDNSDYRSCFLLSPNAHLPVQAVTPEMAMYTARLVGCRLPTSEEWHAALAQVTRPDADAAQWGFAMKNWKLRDDDFTGAMRRASTARPPQYWPNENIFRDASQSNGIDPSADSRIWSPASLATLAGKIAPVPNVNRTDDDQPLPMAAGHLGFREVDDGAHYTGVFHDLIGNAAEFVLDVQPIDGERLDVGDPTHAADVVHNWFTPARRACVAVIGGSALSPPDLDPVNAVKLPADAPVRAFSDVGFRLAFTDPRSITSIDPAKLRAAALEHTEYITAGTAGR